MRLGFELTRFIGRADELEHLHSLVDANRLVTLVGPGGSGKTRLAVEMTRSGIGQFRDGVRFVDLAVLEDPRAVHSEVIAVAALESPADPSDRVLVVLDNCEHVRAAAADAVRSILGSSTSIHVLATSRESLRLPGENLYPLEPLRVPAEDASPRDVEGYDSVRLFIDRARSVDPSFEIGPVWREVAAICRALDGLPLAIELAAPYVRALGVNELLDRVRGSGLDALSHASDREHRQSTLAATVDWSFRLLSEEERLALTALSIFSGSFTLDAAQQILPAAGIGSERVVDLLVSLVDKSLVRVHRRESETWYRLLELVRGFGQRQMEGRDVGASTSKPSIHLERTGEFWTIQGGSKDLLLKDSKGLEYLGHLLERPGVEVPAVTLASPTATVTSAAIETIDPKAKEAYKNRLEELDEQIREAEDFGDTLRLERAIEERQAIGAELSRALGLGGKIRRQGAEAERARMSVTKALRGAIEKVSAQDPELGKHLTRSIRTGTYCGYFPEDVS